MSVIDFIDKNLDVSWTVDAIRTRHATAQQVIVGKLVLRGTAVDDVSVAVAFAKRFAF